MKARNILVTAIGSFSSDCVIASLRKFCDCKIVGCDIYPGEWHAVSKEFDVVLRSPLVKHTDEYLNFIQNTCDQHSIGTIIPLTDVEVDFFNNFKDFFIKQDILVTVGTSEFLSVARNKQKLNDVFKNDDNVKSVGTYTAGELHSAKFPLIAKPKSGRSSEGIYYLSSPLEVKKSTNVDDYIFQEVVEGKICTVDYVRSIKTGRDFSLPRIELLRTANGAGLTIQTFKSEILERLVSYIGNKLGVTGCINMEFIVKDEEYYLIDINPRFSAGVGFSKLAGYDFVKNHLLSFMQEDIVVPLNYDIIIGQKRMVDVINKMID